MTNKYQATIRGFNATIYTSPYASSSRAVTVLYRLKYVHKVFASDNEAIAWATEVLGNATGTMPEFKKVHLAENHQVLPTS